MTLSKPKILFMAIAFFAGFVIVTRVPHRNDNCGQRASLLHNSLRVLLNNQMLNSSNKTVVIVQRLKIVAKKVPHDDQYTTIFHVDKNSRFLDAQTRRFLNVSRFFTFPSKYKKVFVDTLVEFDRIWRQKLNRTYFLYGGTLLGAYRHGQTIPWDDDLDILVDLKYNKTLKQDFKGTKLATSHIASICKLFFTHNGTTTNQYGHWPFIDLFFFKPQKNGMFLKVMGYDLVYSANFLFPATPIPYEGRMFLGPRCPKRVVSVPPECCPHYYNHRLDEIRGGICISCSKLHGLFRFVTWRRINGTHSQQMISDPPEPNKMAALYKSKEEKWKKGPVVFMPKC